MMIFHLWINRHIDAVLLWVTVLALFVLAGGCATIPPSIQIDYDFCPAGMRGDYRVATQHNEDGTTNPVLFLFHIGGPYEKEDILCAISGDHAILDLGKGRQL